MSPNPSLSDDADQQFRLACAELRRRLQAQEACRVETLLQAYPSLASDSKRAIDLIMMEFLVRQELGEQLDPRDWLNRFPQWQDSLRDRLPPLPASDSVRAGDTTEAPTISQGKSAPCASFPLPALGHHELIEEIGSGGMGVVYRAHDPVLDRLVALKMIRSGLFASPAEVERFYREARAAARLRHPHIVPIHGIGLHGGQHCYTMPLLSGGSLADRLVEFQRDPRRAVQMLEKVARAVQAAHDQGIIHRDLKPGNILLDDRGEPSVSDFGLAMLAEAATEIAEPGQVLGTPAYMAPEQAAGRNSEVSAASDVWSLGVVLYELLVGSRPFRGLRARDAAFQVLNTNPPQPRSIRPTLPENLEKIILKCLQKEPSQRYASAAALADELGHWLGAEAEKKQRLSRGRDREIPLPGRGRWAWAGGLLLLILALLAALPMAHDPTQTKPAQPKNRSLDTLHALQRDLAAGKTLQWLTKDSQPRWSRWRTQREQPSLLPRRPGSVPLPQHPAVAETGKPPLPGDELPLSLESLHLALLDLMTDPGCSSFQFSARVQHLQANTGWVGIYFLADEVATPQGTEQRFCAFTFASQGATRGQVRLQFIRYRERNLEAESYERQFVVSLEKRPPMGDPKDWHKLTVRVWPSQVVALWDGVRVGSIPRVRYQPMLRLWWNNLQRGGPVSPLPAYSSRGGLGLYVNHSMARFCDIEIKALADN